MLKFHLADGLYFERTVGGGVRIETTGKRVIETDAAGWASVVASVCERGEDATTWGEALAFHNREPVQTA